MKKGKEKSHKIRLFRIVLISVSIVVAAIIIYPFYPEIGYYFGWIGQSDGEVVALSASGSNNEEGIPEQNTLIIPKIGVDIPIVEGADESVLEQGAWRIPKTSTPDQGGNTVISAHRFKYKPPSTKTFYLLDKLEIGDSFTIYWNGKRYNYVIDETKEVEKTAVEIQDNTLDSRVTLFTCTPLFTTLKRLVVIGKLI